MMTAASQAKPLPHLPADTCRAEDYAAARRVSWVAQSARGLEVLRYRQGWAALDHPQLEKGPAFLKRLDDFGLTSGPAREYWEKTLITKEGDARRRLRAPLAELFRPGQIAKMQKTIRGMVATLLDEIEDPTDVDFMKQLAWRLPAQVYCHLISAPMDQAGEFAHLSDTILAPILTCDRSRREESIAALWRGYAFVEEQIEARRSSLTDDFTSLMIRQQMAGMISQEELILEAMSLLQASMDNTVHQLGLTFGTLLEDPGRWRQLLEQPNLVASAIEETLRLRPRFGTIFRYAREAVAFEDIEIPADSWVFVSVRSAGRDDEMFEDPETFRLGRPPSRAMMFGAGPYNCLGQTLARLEIVEVVRAIMARFPGIRMIGDWSTFDTNAVSETAHLRVALV